MAKISKKVPTYTYRFTIPVQIDRIGKDGDIDFCIGSAPLSISLQALTASRARDKFSKAVAKSFGIKTKGKVLFDL